MQGPHHREPCMEHQEVATLPSNTNDRRILSREVTSLSLSFRKISLNVPFHDLGKCR